MEVFVAALTAEAIRQLAGFRGEDAPVTSCYLDVDGRRFLRHQDYELELDRLLKRMREILSNRTYVKNIVNDLVTTIG